MSARRWLCLATGLLLVACTEETKQKGDDKKTAEANQTTVGDGQAAAGGDDEARDGFYTGFDGVNDFSLLVPNFRELTIEDESVAKVEAVEVTLSAATIESLVAEQKKANPDFDSERFKRMLGRKQTTYRVTPLKAGKTTIATTGGRGGDPGRQQGGWNKSRNIDLVVTAYEPAQLEAGKARYETDGGGGNLRACKSCHETGEEGAPPHELGRIMEVSDKDALKWVKTGKAGGRVAKIQHTWEFSTDAEEAGIVAFLRSKQTHDVETLTKLYVEEMLANGFPGGPPPPGAGAGSGTGTGNGGTSAN